MIDKSTAEDLKLLLTNQGFKKRGNAYFRVIGDGVLQNIKYEYERVDAIHILRFGMHSLYGEILPQWLTSSGCIPNHCIFDIIKGQKEKKLRLQNQEISAREQFDFLREVGIARMNAVTTQNLLADFLCRTDENESGKIYWQDSRKIAPFLAIKDYDSAEKILSKVLVQHYSAVLSYVDCFDNEMIIQSLKRLAAEDEGMMNMYLNLYLNHYEWIPDYLKKNYLKNIELCRTLIK